MKLLFFLLAVCLIPFSGAHSQSYIEQPIDLAPTKTKDGIHFQLSVPDAENVFLAGTFNNWADNNEGHINDERFAMLRDPNTGIWSRYVALEKGIYFMRFVVRMPNKKLRWVIPEYWVSQDRSKNAMFWITAEGNIYFLSQESAKYPTKVSAGQVTFSLYAPGVNSVHIAGKFNNWANNQDGAVAMPSALMNGPDAQGVWTCVKNLPPGQHAYQFVIDGNTWIQDPNIKDEDEEKHSVITIE